MDVKPSSNSWIFVFKNVSQQYKTILTLFGLENEVISVCACVCVRVCVCGVGGYTVRTRKGRKEKGIVSEYTVTTVEEKKKRLQRLVPLYKELPDNHIQIIQTVKNKYIMTVNK